jgi:inner membrane protein YidH
VCKQSLERSGEKLAESAEKIKRSTYGVEDSAERTTQLAADRTVFAAERTYAAWVRTGLLALASGIGAKALLSEVIPQWLIIATGSVLVLFSAFFLGQQYGAISSQACLHRESMCHASRRGFWLP